MRSPFLPKCQPRFLPINFHGRNLGNFWLAFWEKRWPHKVLNKWHYFHLSPVWYAAKTVQYLEVRQAGRQPCHSALVKAAFSVVVHTTSLLSRVCVGFPQWLERLDISYVDVFWPLSSSFTHAVEDLRARVTFENARPRPARLAARMHSPRSRRWLPSATRVAAASDGTNRRAAAFIRPTM